MKMCVSFRSFVASPENILCAYKSVLKSDSIFSMHFMYKRITDSNVNFVCKLSVVFE